MLTGGTGNLKGISEMMEFLYNTKVRIGLPGYIESMGDNLRTPQFATCMGLVMSGFKNRKKHTKFQLKGTMIKIAKKFKNLVAN